MPTSLTGARPRDYSTEYGGIPGVADPFESLRTSLTGNLGTLGDLYKLAIGGSAASAGGAMEQLRQNLPLTPQLLGQRSENILAGLEGQLTTGLKNRLAQTAAERFAGGGFGVDSPALAAAYMAATGRSVEERQDLAQQQLNAAIGATPMGPQFNPMQFMVSPGDFQNWQMYANMLAAAPVPSSAAAAERRALQQGLSAGGGAVPYTGSRGVPSLTAPTNLSGGGPGQVVGPSLGTGTYYNNVLYPAGTSPSQGSYNNWYNWIGGLGTSPTATTGSSGFNFMGDPMDFYTYYGVSPEEWGQAGGTWDNLTGNYTDWETEMYGEGGLGSLYPDVSQETWDTFGIGPWDQYP